MERKIFKGKSVFCGTDGDPAQPDFPIRCFFTGPAPKSVEEGKIPHSLGFGHLQQFSPGLKQVFVYFFHLKEYKTGL